MEKETQNKAKESIAFYAACEVAPQGVSAEIPRNCWIR
jgi:hypothetical protein